MPAKGNAGWWASLFFWGSLLLALGGVWLVFRHTPPPIDTCFARMQTRNDDGSWQMAAASSSMAVTPIWPSNPGHSVDCSTASSAMPTLPDSHWTSPMRILISTMLEDIHAIAVTAALEQRGHKVVRLHHADFPTRQRMNLEYCGTTLNASLAGSALPGFDPREIDVVWNRRHMSARSDQNINADDRDFARRETRAASAALWQLCGPRAFWINPEPAADRAQAKPVQLAAAQRHGLAIPQTLISNDPASVREFVQRHAGVCVYKPLSMGDWFEDGPMHMLYTTKVDAAQLPADRLLQACPGIYQRRVDKHYEVRATFMGAHCCAIRIDSQQTQRGQIDWRQAQGSERMPAVPIELPATVQAGCRNLMAELGLVFGCFDFIVTPEDEWVFLEVNEAGQFLFLEVWCPELPLLDMFCQFLLSRDAAFRYQAGLTSLRYPSSIDTSTLEQINAADRAAHVDTNVWQSMVPLKAAS